MNKINYQKKTDEIIESLANSGEVPTLLLHSCCAPCSSYTLEYLSQYFRITVLYYNPNISPKEEFNKRFAEQKRLIENLPVKHKISLIEGSYDYNAFLRAVKGYEDVPEGGERCFRCYAMRLEESARLAKENEFDYFCTTLSISPLKNSQKINQIGYAIAEKYGVKWLPSDFKKKEGYKRSIELSRQYNLYRQNFCGCVFSKKQAEKMKESSE